MTPYLIKSAAVAQPNTSESDATPEILHCVQIEQGDLRYDFKIYAADPLDAIQRTRRLSHDELELRLAEQYRNRPLSLKS